MQISKLNCYTPAIVRVHIHDNLDIPYPILIWVCWYDENNTRELQLYTWYSTKFVLRCRGTLAQPVDNRWLPDPWPLTFVLLFLLDSLHSDVFALIPVNFTSGGNIFRWGHVEVKGTYPSMHCDSNPHSPFTTSDSSSFKAERGIIIDSAGHLCVCVCGWWIDL